MKDLSSIGHKLRLLDHEGNLAENPPEISSESIGEIAIDKMPAKIVEHIQGIFQAMGLVS